MDMDTLINVSAILFRVSIGVFLLGMVMAALTYWKLNIREVYLIRSGKAKRRTIGELEAHNRETGKLIDNIDLDYTTGNLKKTGGLLGRNSEKTAPDSPFKKGKHSGNTGKFKTATPSAMPEAQQKEVLKSEKIAEKNAAAEAAAAAMKAAAAAQAPSAPIQPLEPAADTQSDAGETVQLDIADIAAPDDYTEKINAAYRQGETGDLDAPAPEELRAPMTIISKELIIHTNEIVEI